MVHDTEKHVIQIKISFGTGENGGSARSTIHLQISMEMVYHRHKFIRIGLFNAMTLTY